MTPFKLLSIIAAILISSTMSVSQQLPLFTQYREYYSTLNPASLNIDYLTSSAEYNVSFGLSYRTQWLNKRFGPRTAMARGEFLGELGNVEIILGGQVATDDTGPTGFKGAYGRFGFIIGDAYTSGLSVGFSVGLLQHRIDGDKLNFFDPGDILEDVVLSKTIPDIGAGVFYFNRFGTRESIFYAGASVPQALGIDLLFEEILNSEVRLTRIRHFYGIVGFLKETNIGQFLDLSAWIKYVPNAPVNVDVNARYQLHERFWIGAGISSSKSVHLEAGYVIDTQSQRLKIGYGHDSNFTSFRPYFGATHELNISYSFGAY